ncbi:MAG: hypothetical protein HC915_19700 [Anaerolineae bacterium]|nr:hypothetical protein [Anaerolineae bacterium]
MARALLARDILIDYRAGAGIRISPHFYNTDEEVHAVIAAMQDILASGAWRPYADPTSFVT